MVETASDAAQNTGVSKLGFSKDQVILELGYDDDVDDALRERIEDVVNSDLEDEDYVDVVDGVLLWWREGDGDLTDALIGAVTAFEDDGFIVLISPKVGRPGEVDPTDIAEAAETAGLQASASVNLTKEWSGTRLVTPKSGRR